jgi:hypothetical protein
MRSVDVPKAGSGQGTASVRKRTLGAGLLAVVAVASASLLFAERHSILGFYDGQREVSCSDSATRGAKPRRDLERHAVSNFYLSDLESSGSVSHVSKRMTYHRVIADFVMGNLLTAAQVRVLFGKTPCSFRR